MNYTLTLSENTRAARLRDKEQRIQKSIEGEEGVIHVKVKWVTMWLKARQKIEFVLFAVNVDFVDLYMATIKHDFPSLGMRD